ncbi:MULTISPECIES: hypothetical protein [Halopseudomonas]|uniref:Organiser of macrodomain of Terminus of chromosome n=1 Tax=Halopseudomonas bauzanensis TaxID=653930 RepID=A0A1H9W7T6_9GAMM|nr:MULTISPECIES: hypothetical protein [Halopseudomonas]WGK63112.1 hypothetical protein QAO71_07860 [Halopseudomonas sp. SMJS2]SES29523.1 Organiser of macrodomain of Terminus of chromosome [Halopseudomonas bauzanensis]SFM29094.1 Organiser of macrodomain of Terminus of chromosome [Halopseudomonas bauzanensis]
MKKQFQLRSRKEVHWTRQWLLGQIQGGRLSLRYQLIELLDTAEQVQQLVDQQLDSESRTRLQKALSARRAREAALPTRKGAPSTRMVRTEVTALAREMLHTVAASRGVTTSELITKLLEDEYGRVAR